MATAFATAARASAIAAPAAAPSSARYDPAAILLELKPGHAFTPQSPSLVRSGSTSLDERLARAAAMDVAPLFPVARADRRLHAALGMDRFYRVRLRRDADIPALAAELSRHPDVAWAEPDYEGSAAQTPAPAPILPNDPYFDHQWALRNTGSVPGIGPSTPGADIHATEGWGVTTGDSSVIVAVLDSGIRYDYPEFAGRIWSNSGEIAANGIDDDGNGYVDDVRGYNFAYGNAEVLDDLGHGNAVSGVIGAASNDGAGYCGLDWACRIMPVKILSSGGTGSYSWWVSGIYYAVNNGARILNMSLVGDHASVALQTAIRYAYAHECLIVAAMGNSGADTPYVPASYDTEVLAVGATDRNDRRASFSTYGSHLDVVAPGQDIAVLVLGTETYASYGSGTSFASPMVAGLASLLLAKNPSLGAAALHDIICLTADDQVGASSEDAPGWDRYYGYGRIDCARALTLEGIPHPPSVSAPGFLNPIEGRTTAFSVSASDPDGDPIQKLEADLSVLPRSSDAAFSTNGSGTSGTLTWTPTFEDAGGPYSVTFRAFDPLRGQAVTTMYVANVNRLPAVAAPAAAAFVESEEGQFGVLSTDPDGEELILSASDVPPGGTFEDHGDNTGTFAWTPAAGQAGSYTVSFSARDGWNGTAAASTRVDVGRRNRAPMAEAAGPYAGVAGAPIGFDGSGSADPDGDPLRCLWRFGDGSEAVGAAPVHAYTHGGDFVVILEVDDGSLSNADSTTARIAAALPARAFLADGRRSIALSGGSAPVCLCLEPSGGAYANADLDLTSLAVVSDGTGAVSRVAPSLRSIVEGDRDRNGVLDLSLCFDRSDLRRLFERRSGRDSVVASIEGRLANGAKIEGPIRLVVVGTRACPVSVSSNPLAAGGVITLRTISSGRLSARLFDARGRLVRTLAEEPAAAPGYRDLAFDGRGDRGAALPSGIYFIRVETLEGVSTSRVAILK